MRGAISLVLGRMRIVDPYAFVIALLVGTGATAGGSLPSVLVQGP